MPRYPRRTVSGALVHAISRVVDQEFRIDDHARAEYLRRVGRVAPRSGWVILAYALMSNHVHWLLHCLGVPIRELIHPLHSGFGHWLNRRDGRLTPVFAERPKTWLFEPHAALRLIAYIHNNPVRAGTAASARDSSWTSHRAYVGDEEAPAWLDIDAGMALCELPNTAAGRGQLDHLVDAEVRAPRDPLFSDARMSRARRELRAQLNAPVELATPTVTHNGVEHCLVGTTLVPCSRPRWDGPLQRLIDEAAGALGLPPAALSSRDRTRDLVRGRRLVLLAAVEHLGRTVAEASRALGLSVSAGSKLLRRAPELCDELEPVAQALASRLRAGG